MMRLVGKLRIMSALVSKDITDAIKNRDILRVILSVSFLMVFYRMMPILSERSDPPLLALYDAGNSRLVAQLEESERIDLIAVPSRPVMEIYLGSKSAPIVGLALPPDFDQVVENVENGERLEIDGYLDHWVSDSTAAEKESFFEAELTQLTGKPVRLRLLRDTVYTQQDGWHPFIASLSALLLLTVVGLFIIPGMMLEEKETRTMDVLLVSPASAGLIVIGKAGTGLIFCLAAAAVWLAFNSALVVHWGLLLLSISLGALFVVALGLLLGTIIGQRQHMPIWGFVLVQPLLLGPVFAWFPLVPDNIQVALSWIPTSALGVTLRLSCAGSAPLADYWPELIWVFVSTVLLLAADVWLLRRSDR